MAMPQYELPDEVNMNFVKRIPAFVLLLAVSLTVLFLLGACTSVYYSTMEKLGKQKRDLLRDNVEELRDDQMEASEEFKDALTQLQELTNYHGGKLQDVYEDLADKYEDCKERTEAIKNRINKIDMIAGDLFEEWQDEIDSMSSPDLKRRSLEKLRASKNRYRKLYRAMKRAEAKMEPVLTTLHDHVLFLKHNLNASTIAGLKGEVGRVKLDVQSLIREMKASIAEADAFIKTLPE